MSNFKRVVISSGLAFALAVGLGATAVAGGRTDHKVQLCHRTSADRFVEISVAKPALPAHLAHGDMLADDYGECP